MLPVHSPFQCWCSIDCGVELGRKRLASKRQKADRADRKRRKEKIKTLGEWVKHAQAPFNEFIRVRDYGNPCISCGKHKPHQCGHHRTVASAPELRFNTKAANGQCVTCNQGSAKYVRNARTIAQKYDEGVAARYGQDRLDWVKGDHPAKQYRADDLQRIARLFRRRARHYKKLRGL